MPFGDVDNLVHYIKPRFDISKIRTIIDCGSRDLQQSIQLSKFWPEANVYAFQANPNSAAMCRNRATRYSKIHAHTGFALSDNNNESIDFYQVAGNVGASSCYPKTGEYDHIQNYQMSKISVPARRFDTWANQQPVSGPYLLWLDAQGAELKILKGMGNHINDVLAIHTQVQFQKMYDGGVLFDEINAWLEQRGFTALIGSFINQFWSGDAIYVRNEFLPYKKDLQKCHLKQIRIR